MLIMANTYITHVQYDETSDDYFITLEEEMLESLGWEIGDDLEWEEDEENGGFMIRKA
jgi:bifunctional DNA-binding transcriptional regulator/antitoxin component of YhaV-PrlF toxin-antitoxin module